jgi:DegV family protein with EDD domain
MSKKVAIVTDSTTYLPEELTKNYKIVVTPAIVIWGDDEYRDGVDIQPKEFYEKLSKASVMPTTSQPSPGAVKVVFDELLAEGYDILCVNVSSKLSGTYSSFVQAKAMLPDANIELIDSKLVSMGAGWAILEAAKVGEKGGSLADMKQATLDGLDKSGLFLTVGTLEFLHRGGRIGGASRYLGSVLQLKPILAVVDGALDGIDRVRTRRKALNRVVELVLEKVEGKKNVRIGAIHANAEDEAIALSKMFEGKCDLVESTISKLSPAVGTQVGPGTLGIGYMFD